MRCESLGPRLSAWVDGELPMLSAWLVARHVATCPACAAEVEELRALNTQLAAANPVLDPLLAPVFKPQRRISTPLVGAGALMAAGVAGFFLLPRLPEPEHTNTVAKPTPQTSRAVSEADKSLQERAPAPGLKPPAAAPPAPTKKILPGKPLSVAVEPERSVTTETPRRSAGRARQRVRRSAPKVRAELSRVRERKSAIKLPTEPIKVATADKADLDLSKALAISRARDVATPVQEPDPETLKVFEKMSPITPVTPPAAIEAAPDAMNVKKSDVRMTFGAAARARPITSMRPRDEMRDSIVPRKKVVPVLVVTPTRYENVVTVTAGALEVDDTDDKEETPQP